MWETLRDAWNWVLTDISGTSYWVILGTAAAATVTAVDLVRDARARSLRKKQHFNVGPDVRYQTQILYETRGQKAVIEPDDTHTSEFWLRRGSDLITTRTIRGEPQASPAKRKYSPWIVSGTVATLTVLAAAGLTLAIPSDKLLNLGLWVYYFGLMMFGMVGQYMFRLKRWKGFDLEEFVQPMWVSFIVFTPFWFTVSPDSINYAASAGAYQNGFFWKIVFDHQQREAESTAAASVAAAAALLSKQSDQGKPKQRQPPRRKRKGKPPSSGQNQPPGSSNP
jgi:hypothetical protein